MTKEELIEQLESLRDNQKDFIPNDDTGEFERDCKALELACELIEKISDTDYNDLIDYFITEEEYEEMYDDGNGDSYWTEWED